MEVDETNSKADDQANLIPTINGKKSGKFLRGSPSIKKIIKNPI